MLTHDNKTSSDTLNLLPLTYEGLMEYNESQLQKCLKTPFFSMLKDDSLANPLKIQAFLDGVQVFSNFFQIILFSRQATCFDKTYQAVFLSHLQEEIGHDQLLAARKTKHDIKDPILHATSSWFCYQMFVLDNIEKTALIHLILEIAGYYCHTLAKDKVSMYVQSNYYELHHDNDEEHTEMGRKLLKGQHPKVYQNLYKILDAGWSMFNAMADRITYLVEQADKPNNSDQQQNSSNRHEFNLTQLINYNTECLHKFSKNLLFKEFQKGTLNNVNSWKIFLNCIQIWINKHHAPNKKIYDNKDNTIFDPVLEAIIDWFSYQMIVLDSVEKFAIIDLVIKNFSLLYHDMAKPYFPEYINSEYFNLKFNAFYTHVNLDKTLLENQTNHTYSRLAEIVEQAWGMVEAMFDRIALNIYGQS